MTALDDLLLARGRTRADLPSTGLLGQLARMDGVPACAEIERIAALPPNTTPPEIRAVLTWVLRRRATRPDGSAVELFPAQADALHQLITQRGVFAPLRCSAGKTLVSLLAPVVVPCTRPLLVVPARLREKTRREFAAYADDWHCVLPRIVSYQELGLVSRAHLLDQIQPDLVILDEAHFARNPDAAVSRRLHRYLDAARPMVVAMSGTLITDRLEDYRQICVASLRDAAPVPRDTVTADRWAQALDRDTGSLRRLAPGALNRLPGGFHAHLRSRAGVACYTSADCDAAIEITLWRPDLPPELARKIDDVAGLGQRPDGEPLDPNEAADCQAQLALGFFYIWDPTPPAWWLDPRRVWVRHVRELLEQHDPALDSPFQIAQAIDAGAAPGRAELKSWRAVKDRYEPTVRPIWITDAMLRAAVKRAGSDCLIWTRYRASGERLDALGVPYYGGGTDPRGAHGTIAVSIAAHGTGQNLQRWSRNQVLTLPGSASAWEQLISRTHRRGQRADTVSVDVAQAIDYQREIWTRVRAHARSETRASGARGKILDATIVDD